MSLTSNSEHLEQLERMLQEMPAFRESGGGIQAELQGILEALRQSTQTSAVERQTLNSKLDEVARKQDSIPNMLADLERRQQAALDVLRRDFERMFVSHAEYDPKHQTLLDRMKEYDKLIADSRERTEEYVVTRDMVLRHEQKIKNIEDHRDGTSQRILGWIAIVVSAASVLLNYAQHIHFTP